MLLTERATRWARGSSETQREELHIHDPEMCADGLRGEGNVFQWHYGRGRQEQDMFEVGALRRKRGRSALHIEQRKAQAMSGNALFEIIRTSTGTEGVDLRVMQTVVVVELFGALGPHRIAVVVHSVTLGFQRVTDN